MKTLIQIRPRQVRAKLLKADFNLESITATVVINASDLFFTAHSFWPGMFGDYSDSDPHLTWGDANRTLVTAERLADDIENCFQGDDGWGEKEQAWVEKVRGLGQIYIDLEN